MAIFSLRPLPVAFLLSVSKFPLFQRYQLYWIKGCPNYIILTNCPCNDPSKVHSEIFDGVGWRGIGLQHTNLEDIIQPIKNEWVEPVS